MSKKLLIIIISVVVIVVLIAAYFLFIKKDSPINIINNTTPDNSAKLPESDQVSGNGIASEFPSLSLPIFSKIVSGKAIDPTLSDSGEEILYYSPDKGEFYAAKINGSGEKAITDKQFTRVKNVKWSSDGEKAIITFGSSEGDDDKIFVYDFFEKTLNILNAKITDPVFSPDATKIVYQYTDKMNRIYNMSTADTNGSNFKIIKDFYSPKSSIVWDPNFNKIFITDYPSNEVLSNIYALKPDGSSLKKVGDAKYGISAVFSPEGDGIVVSYFETGGKKPTMVYMDKNGKFIRNLHVPTMAYKSVFSHDGKYLYAAVPTSIPGAVTIRDYLPSGKSLTKDQIWKISLMTGEKKLLVDPQKYNFIIDANNPFLSHDGKLMFFWDKGDNGVYAVNLSKAEEEAGVSSSGSSSEGSGGTSTNSNESTDGMGSTTGDESDSSSTENGTSSQNTGKTPEERLFEKLFQ